MPRKAGPAANLADPAYRWKLMRDTVRVVRDAAARGEDLYYPLLNLVAVFIDGLASGAKTKTRTAYLVYLTHHFPDLCAALGAATFYEAFRCKAVHEFGIKPGFAIGRDSGLKGSYVDVREVQDAGDHITLNIDRLVRDFLTHVEGLLGDRGARGSTTGPARH